VPAEASRERRGQRERGQRHARGDRN
jgi:hypothetical protein